MFLYRILFDRKALKKNNMELKRDEDYIWTPEYKTLPKDHLNIPSVHMMGYANFDKTWNPLNTHYHKMLEVVVVLNGAQQYFVDGKKYVLHGRDVFIAYPDEPHGNMNMPQNVCEFIWFQLDLSSTEAFLGLTGKNALYIYNCIRKFMDSGAHMVSVEDKDIRLMKKTWDCISSGSEAVKTLGYSCLLSFIIQIFCVMGTENKRKDISEDIQNALSYIDGNLSSTISIRQVAEFCGLSESRFKSKFKEEMGITPLAYINTEKIELAKFLLKEDIISITDIAFSLAFSSSNYFSSVFRKYTGYTPSEYKEKFPKNI